ncbi:unnamed protein product [Ilex paraguariensis]|uniref:DUS-like FMN-binding domain-containing protein n=1 Tax=Ilex paraguariensis TaxID=185542 RepID=A0ABC8U8L0_9AQUA
MVAGRYFPPWFSVAPMMDWTDNHFRTLARLISKHAWLYTEMIAAETIVYQTGNLVSLCNFMRRREFFYEEFQHISKESPTVVSRGGVVTSSTIYYFLGQAEEEHVSSPSL